MDIVPLWSLFDPSLVPVLSLIVYNQGIKKPPQNSFEAASSMPCSKTYKVFNPELVEGRLKKVVCIQRPYRFIIIN